MSDEELRERAFRAIRRGGFASEVQFSPDATLEEIGLDSLDSINIVFALEQEFGVEVPVEGINRSQSVNQILAMLGTLVSQQRGPESSSLA